MILLIVALYTGFFHLTSGETDVLSGKNEKRFSAETLVLPSQISQEIPQKEDSITFKQRSEIPLSSLILSEFPKGKVVLKDGQTFTGGLIRLYPDRITLHLDGSKKPPTTFQIGDVQQAEGKGRKPRRFAGICGGGCMGVFLAAFAGTGSSYIDENTGQRTQYESGQFLVVGVVYSLLASAAGAVVGMALDEWTVFYSGS